MRIDKTAKIHTSAIIGNKTVIWDNVKIRESARIGKNCHISRGVYIGKDVIIGSNVKIQNDSSIYEGTILEDGVFVGPHVIFTNDKYPRAINPDGSLKEDRDWKREKSLVKYGASIGANCTILPGLTIGKFATIGAGSVVTKNVPDFALVVGNPGKIVGKVNKEGITVKPKNG